MSCIIHGAIARPMSRLERVATNASGDRTKRLKAVRKKLMAAAGLRAPLSAADELRIETAAWTQLAVDNMRNAIMAGRIVDVADLEHASAALVSVLPTPQQRIEVDFIDVLQDKDGNEISRSQPMTFEELQGAAKAETIALDQAAADVPKPAVPPETPKPLASENAVPKPRSIHDGAHR